MSNVISIFSRKPVQSPADPVTPTDDRLQRIQSSLQSISALMADLRVAEQRNKKQAERRISENNAVKQNNGMYRKE